MFPIEWYSILGIAQAGSLGVILDSSSLLPPTSQMWAMHLNLGLSFPIHVLWINLTPGFIHFVLDALVHSQRNSYKLPNPQIWPLVLISSAVEHSYVVL